MKRYYIPNRKVEVDDYHLQITGGGTVYMDMGGGTLEVIDSLWLEKLRQFCVSLPNGEMVRLKPAGEELKIIRKGLGIYA